MQGSEDAHRNLKYAVATIAALVLCQGIQMVPVLRDELMSYLGIGDARFGFLLSVLSGAGLITVLVGGVAVDRWGPRRVLRAALLGAASALALLAVAGKSWIVVALGLGLYGLALRPLAVGVSNYLIRLFPGNRRRVLSLNFAGRGTGALFFPSLAEGLLSLRRRLPSLSFATIFHLPFAVLSGLILGCSFFYRRRRGFKGTGDSTNRQWHWKDMLLRPVFLPLIGLLVLHETVDVTLGSWMARFLDSGSFTRTVIGPGYILSARAVAYIVSRTILGFMPETAGRRALMVIPGLLGGTVLIWGLLSHNYLLTAGGYVLGAFLWSAEYPTILSVVAHGQPDRFGAAMALHQLLSGAAVFLSLNGMGMLVAQLGEAAMWKAMLIPACGFPLVGIGAALWLLTCGSGVSSVEGEADLKAPPDHRRGEDDGTAN